MVFKKLNNKLERPCKLCFTKIVLKTANQLYCDTCRDNKRLAENRAWRIKKGIMESSQVCPVCNIVFRVSRQNRKYCSTECNLKNDRITVLQRRLQTIQNELMELHKIK